MVKARSTHVRRVKLSDYRDKKTDEGAIILEGNNGEEFKVPPPELWSDDVLRLSETDQVAAATEIMGGEDAYAAFVAAGGSALMLLAIVQEEHGATVPE